MPQDIQLHIHNGEPLADSREMAVALSNKHKNVMTLISDYEGEFRILGVLAFETDKPSGGALGGRPPQHVMLNEDQCFFLLTLVRNTDEVVRLKLRLVQLFRKARDELARAAPALPTDPLELLALSLQSLQLHRGQILELQTDVQAIGTRLDNTPIRMDSVMTSEISKLCQDLGRVHPGAWPGAYRSFKEAMGEPGIPLARYDALPIRRFDEAKRWLELQIESFKQSRPLAEHWDREPS